MDPAASIDTPLDRATYERLYEKLKQCGAAGKQYRFQWTVFVALGEAGQIDDGWSLEFRDFMAWVRDQRNAKEQRPGSEWDAPRFRTYCSQTATALMQAGCHALGWLWHPRSEKVSQGGEFIGLRFVKARPTKRFRESLARHPFSPVQLANWLHSIWWDTVGRNREGDIGAAATDELAPAADQPVAPRDAGSSTRVSTDATNTDAQLSAYLHSLPARLRFVGLREFCFTDQRDMPCLPRRLRELRRSAAEPLQLDAVRNIALPACDRPQAELFERVRMPGDGRRVCVFGDAGVGKSTLLEQMALHLATAATGPTAEPVARIPILANMKNWTGLDGHTLQQVLADPAAGLPESLVSELCATGRAAILLDGLDEIQGAPSARGHVLGWLNTQVSQLSLKLTTVVVAGRSWAFDGTLMRQFCAEQWRLSALQRAEIDAYIGNHLRSMPSRASAVCAHLAQHRALHPLVARPLFLLLLCYQCRDPAWQAPTSAGALVEGGLQKLLCNRGLSDDSALNVLGRIAWLCWCKGAKSITDRQARQGLRVGAAGGIVASLWNQVREHSGVLVRVGQSWRFTAMTFREYLAGRYLAGRTKQGVLRVFGRRAWDPRWTDVLLYMTEWLWREKPRLAEQLITWLLSEIANGYDDMFGTLARLACHMLGRAGGGRSNALHRIAREVAAAARVVWSRTAIWTEVTAMRRAVQQAMVDLAVVADDEVVDCLRAAPTNDAVACASAETLMAIGTEGAVQALQSMLASAAPARVRAYILEVIGGTEHAT
jgi:hypothetical protein